MIMPVLASAQHILKGKVTDLQTGYILAGATIASGDARTSANEKGEFELPLNSPTITVSYIGYETRQLRVPGNTEFLNIEMTGNGNHLNSVTVTGYENNRRLMETAGSIALLTSKEIQRGSNIDIKDALNTVPGVKMEDYVPGDYRISIRGSVISDPWGIRNIKLYWNDIPLSSPDGTASHGVDIDPSLIGSMEILKGPSASLYGSGNGGVILFKSSKGAFGQDQLEAGYTGGSYGLNRFNAHYKTGGEHFNVAANFVDQHYDGYRENGWSKKTVLNLFSQIMAGEKRTVSFFINHATGGFGIAGGLDSAQVAQNPQQAVQFCKDNKTSVKKYDFTMLGASQQYRFNDKFQNTSSVYGSFQTLDHPFGESASYNGYLKESTGGYGARTRFTYSTAFGKLKARFTLGDEYQYQHQLDNQFQITNDKPGTWPEPGAMTEDLILISHSNIAFAQAELDLPSKTFLTLGASYNKLYYDVEDLMADSTANFTGRIGFAAKLSPRIGLVQVINKNMSAHASISYGYSPPPTWEINNFDGTLNTSIRPEDGVNYEIGIRGDIGSKLNYDITAYRMFLSNAIVPMVNAYGNTQYRNAGKTDQKGIEATLSYLALGDRERTITLLKPWISISKADYRFKNYLVETFDWSSYSIVKKDNSGNKVTGVVPFNLVAGVDIDTKPGIYFNTVFYYYDRAPMNDANTAYSNAYSLLNAKLGYKTMTGHFGFDLFAGVNNAFDAKYSSLISLNADANGEPAAWFNPSPGINFYGGIKLKYAFSK